MFAKRSFAALLLASTLVLTGAGCGGSKRAEQAATEKVTLKIWRVFDESDTFKETMTAYRAIHPNVSFEYRTLRYEEYQDELLKAFAEGTGPDIFSVHNSWLGGYENLISPLPDSLTIPYTETRGTVKKESVTVLREEPTISIRTLKKDYVDAVAKDVIREYQPNPKAEPEERIFGLPLSVDTLALFYNRDLLNAAAVAEPPADWESFQKAVAKLSSIGPNETIIQSGAALGTSRNIERAFDILSLLMMQNGTSMTNERGQAAFAEPNAARTLPGVDAVRFYTEFASPLKDVYSWNENQPNSFDAFVSGKTAFFFGYAYHLPLIRARSPKLNFAVAPTPQIGAGNKEVNYANYWIETVSKGSAHSTWAWDFIQFATGEEQVQSYLTAAAKPPARRALIEGQLEDEDLGAFAAQLLTAESWYRGDDAAVAEEAFLDLIDAANEGIDVQDAADTAQQKVNQTL